jgi:hypothetical protein
MPQFILLIREDLTKYPRPEEEMKEVINAHIAWAKELSAKGIFKDGNGIKSKGNLLEMLKGEVLVQPLRDVKEAVGGYYIIDVADFESALDVAKSCPTFTYGDLVEVRELGA